MSEIRLISDITVTPIQQMGGDHMVAAAAKVSVSGADARELLLRKNGADRQGLINYLMKHRHGSPFEHGAMTFFVHMPLFVAQEWTRHRAGWSYNGESGRYKTFEPVFWIPRRDRPLVKVEGYKAARPEFEHLESAAAYEWLKHSSYLVYETAYRQYRNEIEQGLAPEVARRLLPTATYTSYWVTCNPRSLMHFISLRTHDPEATTVSYPQEEIEEAARAAEEVLKAGWPDTYKAFVRNGRVAP